MDFLIQHKVKRGKKMKKWFELSEGITGKPLASYARNQPGKDLILLDEPKEEHQIWNGKSWVDSPEKESILALKEIAETDKDMLRVIDDILDYIINGVPIPDVAKNKLNNRKALRDKI